jgi:predicted negative regulator of RcsB-dependent stress response
VDTQTRHALKQDRFINATHYGLDWVGDHRASVVRWSVAVVLVIAVIVAGVVVYEQRDAAAHQLLGQAMDIYETPLARAGQPVPPGQKTYASAAERAKAANPIFREVADRYGWLNPGEMARYFAGVTEIDLGQQSQAEADLKKAADSHDSNLAALAKVALANLYEQTGRTSEAVAEFENVIQHPTTSVPKAAAQLQLAALYEKTDTQKARQLYAQIKDQNKTTDAGQIADQKLTALK